MRIKLYLDCILLDKHSIWDLRLQNADMYSGFRVDKSQVQLGSEATITPQSRPC